MKIRSQQDFWSGVMFTVVGAGFAVGSLNYAFGSSARPGPAYFPFGLGVLLALIGLLKGFQSLTIETETGDPIGAVAWKPLVMIVGSVVVFALALPVLGMFISLPLLIILSALAGDEFKWRDVALSCVVLTVGSWAIFDWALNLTIPLLPAFVGH